MTGPEEIRIEYEGQQYAGYVTRHRTRRGFLQTVYFGGLHEADSRDYYPAIADAAPGVARIILRELVKRAIKEGLIQAPGSGE